MSTYFVLDAIPEKWLVGIDLHFFETNEHFKGIKMLPKGFHILHWGQDISSLRSGYILVTGEDTQMLAFGYDKPHETLIKYQRSDLQYSTLESRLEGYLPYMLKYPTDDQLWINWRQLTSCIDSTIISRICPESMLSTATTSLEENEVLMSSLEQAALDRANASSTANKTSNRDQILAQDPVLSSIRGMGAGSGELKFYAKIDLKRTWRPDAQGAERSHQARDMSWYVSHLIETQYGNHQTFVAEFQLCFILMIILASYAACQQWKRMLSLILRSKDTKTQDPTRFRALLDLILLQLEVIPTAYIDDLVERDFLRNLLSNAVFDEIISPESEKLTQVLQAHCMELDEDSDEDQLTIG